MLAGLTYYWPKMFGFMLNEKIGKWTFWLLSIGFVLAFFPMYITGLDGQARRMYTYSEATGFGPLNMLSFVGAGIMAIAFALIVYNVYYSIRYSPRNIGADPWDARTLEWATHTPVPEYNFAIHTSSWCFRFNHSGMRRKKDMNYSQENIKRFICQIIVVLHLSWVLSSLYGDSRLYLPYGHC